MAGIHAVELTTTHTAKLVTVQGDLLLVTLTNSTVELRTGFGKIEVKVNLLKKIP